MKIALRGSAEMLFDEVDADFATSLRWYATKSKRTFYATTVLGVKDGKRVTQTLHRLIMLPPKGMQVDHINGNGLDNRRCNLRICTPNQNRKNTRSYTGSSRYKGVAYVARRHKWRADITVDAEQVWLGYHKTEESAAMAYNLAATQLHGDFACLNILGTNGGAS